MFNSSRMYIVILVCTIIIYAKYTIKQQFCDFSINFQFILRQFEFKLFIWIYITYTRIH